MLLGLAGCAAMPARQAAPAPASPQPLTRLTVAIPDDDHNLTAQLLAGEMALARTDLKAAAAAYGKAATLSDDPRVAGQAAALAIAVHDDAAARRALDRWQALGAKPAPLAQLRAQLALDGGHTDEARLQLEKLTASGDKNAWRDFGRVLLGSRDPAVAGRLLEALATPERLPADPQAWLAMSEMGDHFGRHAYARHIADAAMQRFHSAETYAWAAQMKFRNGDRKGAMALFRKAQAKDPKDIRLRLAYASLLQQGGDAAQAASVLENGPQDTDTYAMRAGLAAAAKDRAALARIYDQLGHASDEQRTDGAYLLGQLAETLDRPDDALKWYAQVADDDPHAFDADLRSAVLLQAQGKSAQAHEQLAQMQADYLDQPKQLRQAYEVDADLYMREQRYDEAVDAFVHALQVAPDDPALLYGRGLAYAEAGRIDAAVADFRHLLKLKPGDVEASNALGFTLADADRDLPEAEKLIAAARKAKPDDPSIADSWGWLQYRLGHLDQAEAVLRGAWQASRNADIGAHLAEVLWKQGRHQEARQLFDEAHKLDPHNATLQDALKRLHP
ncbi:tetratricopeptide repeat protein [Fulvimonas sp. R45]|uniref:tetratricopeptide repeat protein n=1 Tax=Fulvimonas sp. R45 TaxID=3045937 RepID=UPI00265FC36D|nr:tetratricopeptide repeat protein [Fulvimonas sp. R45]MDO1530377.1 tetratricopeptide repeat protein [Fulvimonas sp. R45]